MSTLNGIEREECLRNFEVHFFMGKVTINSGFSFTGKGLLRNKDITKKCKLDVFKILLYKEETWTSTK